LKIDRKERVDESSFKYRIVAIYLIVDYPLISFERGIKNYLMPLYAAIRFESLHKGASNRR
jgi:hypothetical protein